MRVFNRVPSTYGRRNYTGQTIAGHSRHVVSYSRSALVSEREQYPMVFAVSSGHFKNVTDLTRRSQASVSSVIRRSMRGNVRTGADISFCKRFFIASSSIALSSKRGSAFKKIVARDDAIFAKLATNRLKTLQRARTDVHSVAFRSNLSPSTTSVICDRISIHLERIMWRK